MNRQLLIALGVCSAYAPGTTLATQIEYLEEVIVTSTKREESVQDVPIAVTAFDAEALSRAGVKDLRGLSSVAPSFNMNSSNTESDGTTLRLRGVGTTGNNIGLESAVGVFLDGVYLSRAGIALGDLMDVESIEVLRGPQGTLFGRNTSAGALNIRTKGPSFDDDEYFANLTVGNYGQENVQAGATGPISDTVAYRLSAAVRKQDGFMDSVTGAESRTRDRWLVRGQLAFEPSNDLSIRVIADYADLDEQCCDAVVLSQGLAYELGAYEQAGLPANGGVSAWGDSAFEGMNGNSFKYENPQNQYGVSVEVNWDINDSVSLTYIGAYRDFDSENINPSHYTSNDLFSVAPNYAGGFVSGTEVKSWTQELRFAGETDRVSWMVGGYMSDEDIWSRMALGFGADYAAYVDANLYYTLAPALGLSAGAPLLADIPLATGGTFGDVLAASSPSTAFAGGVGAAGAFASNAFEQQGTSWSIFTHNIIHITDSLDFVVGLRYTSEEKDGSFQQEAASNNYCMNTLANADALTAGAAATGSAALQAVAGGYAGMSLLYSCLPQGAPALGIANLPTEFDDTYTDDELVYTAKAVYAFTDDISGYLGFTHGFKAGGFNLDPTAAASGTDPRFNSELIDSWEVGLKMDLLDHRVRMNIAAWDYDVQDFQVLEWTGTQFQTLNVPKTESQGYEVELTALPMEGLRLNMSYTHAESEYSEDCDNNIPSEVSGFCGAPFTNSPEDAVTYGFTWDSYFGNGMHWFFSANARWEDDRRTDTTKPNLMFDYQGANNKVNARFGIGKEDGSWMVELWGNNITDKRTKNMTFNTPLRVESRAAFMEAPRTYGLTLSTRM